MTIIFMKKYRKSADCCCRLNFSDFEDEQDSQKLFSKKNKSTLKIKYAPDHSIRGHKKSLVNKILL